MKNHSYDPMGSMCTIPQREFRTKKLVLSASSTHSSPREVRGNNTTSSMTSYLTGFWSSVEGQGDGQLIGITNITNITNTTNITNGVSAEP